MTIQHHRIQAALDRIWNAGHTPKIVVDSSHKDVVIPEFVRAKWKENLPIDLLASYPLNLTYSETGISVDLAFSGSVCRCTFPWTRIRLVIDREAGTVFKGETDADVEPQVPPILEVPPVRGWSPRVIKGGKS